MTILRSSWTPAPIDVATPFTAAKWAGAGTMPLPVGSILAKNDNQFAYIALDLIGDTGNSPGTSDYFWLTFDVDRNRSISPHLDVNYGTYPTLPIRIGHQLYLGPNQWTGLLAGISTAAINQTFGASAASATPHRIWQMRIPFSEIGVALTGTPPDVPFGLRLASSTPAFTHDVPANFSGDFSHLHDLIFATGPAAYPAGTAGVTIGGVGSIPATKIDATGRATTDPAYVPHVVNAAFGGVLNILGNNVTLGDLYNVHAARKYRVLHRQGTAGAFTNFRQAWYNYHWVGSIYVLESFGPDTNDMYPLPNPADDYSIQKLLMQWNTGGAVNDVHQFQVQFFTAANAPVASPAQTLTLLVDNSAPDVQILGLRYGTHDIAPCDIVDITAPAAAIQVHIRAFDTAGNLAGYSLGANFGMGQSVALASASYPGSGTWQGTADTWITAPPTFPPQACAYGFSLGASKRITNGYDYIGSWSASEYVTLNKH
jgi:hypothetical protein